MGGFRDITFVRPPADLVIPPTKGNEIVVIFTAFDLHTQTYKGSAIAEDYMCATVFYDLVFQGKPYTGLETAVKQSQVSYENDPIELTTPATGGYNGPFPIEQFDDAVIAYFRARFGIRGDTIQFAPGWDSRFTNCRFEYRSDPIVLQIPAKDEPCGGWLFDLAPRWRKPHEKPASGVTPLGEVRKTNTPSQSAAERLNRDN